MGIISRGFSGRRSAADVKLPPGQYLTTDFPVLSAGPTPDVPLDRWEFVIDDGTNVLRRWDWKSFRDLPTETFTVDLHCVTRWSKLGTTWEGVSLDVMLGDVRTDASYAMELETSLHVLIASASSIGYDWGPAACRRWNEDVFSPFRDSSRFRRQSPDCCVHRTPNVPNSALEL